MKDCEDSKTGADNSSSNLEEDPVLQGTTGVIENPITIYHLGQLGHLMISSHLFWLLYRWAAPVPLKFLYKIIRFYVGGWIPAARHWRPCQWTPGIHQHISHLYSPEEGVTSSSAICIVQKGGSYIFINLLQSQERTADTANIWILQKSEVQK